MTIDARSAGTLPRRQIWTIYGYLAVFAYLLYAIGQVTPYLRADLGLTEFQAGLHASAVAAGTLTAGLLVDLTMARLGSARVLLLSVLGSAAAALFVIGAPFLFVSLGGAYLVGLSGGALGTYVNITLGGTGAIEGRKLLARANAWAMGAALFGPVVIAVAASSLHAWRLALLLPVFGLAVLAVIGANRSVDTGQAARSDRPLPGSFWVAWILILLAVSIEFSFVFWASTLVVARTGVAQETATLAAGLFIAGMLVGRTAVGLPQLERFSPRFLLMTGLALVVAGALVTWLATDAPLSAAGAFVAGAGTAGLYPLGVTVALRSAGSANLAAGARITLASGVAILLAPTFLGLLADAVGVVAAWPVVLALATAAILTAVAATRGQPAADTSAAMSNNPDTERYRSPVS